MASPAITSSPRSTPTMISVTALENARKVSAGFAASLSLTGGRSPRRRSRWSARPQAKVRPSAKAPCQLSTVEANREENVA